MRALLAILACLVIGPAAQAQPHGDGGVLRLFAVPSGTQSFPPFIIRKFNLDVKYGFKMEFTPYSDPKAAFAAVQGGAADVLVLDWPAIARLQTGGVPLVAIAPFLTYVNSVMVPVNSTLHGLPDLAGKRVGVFSRTSMDWIIMEAAAQKLYGIDLQKTVQMQEGSPGLLRGASEQGQLDATQIYNSIAPEMLASGRFKTLFTIRSLTEALGFPDEPYLFYAMNADYAAKHPDNARAFVAAYREVVRILKTDDAVWTEQGGNLGLSEGAIKFFRDEVRADIVTEMTLQTEATLHATFDILLKTAGSDVLGMSTMPDHVVTLQYQP